MYLKGEVDALALKQKELEFRSQFKNPKVKELFRRNVAAVMNSRGMGITSLADKGLVDKVLLSKLVKGHKFGIKYLSALRIAQALEVSLDSLLTKDFVSAINNAITGCDRTETQTARE